MDSGEPARILEGMATISHSDQAPKGSVHYLLASAEFDLGGKKKSYETDDPATIAEALVHPWLTVEYTDDPEGGVGKFAPQLAPEDDHLSFINDRSNDQDLVEETEADKDAVDDKNPTPTPLDAEAPADDSAADTKPSDEKDQD